MIDNVNDSYRHSLYRSFRQSSIENGVDPLHEYHHYDDNHNKMDDDDNNNELVTTRNQQLIYASLIENQHHEDNDVDERKHHVVDDDGGNNDQHHFNEYVFDDNDNQYSTNCDTTWISIDSCIDQQQHNNKMSNHRNHRINNIMKHNHNTNSKSFELLSTLSNHIQPIDYEDDDSNSSVESSSPAKILMNLEEFSIHENRRRSSGQFNGLSPVRTGLSPVRTGLSPVRTASNIFITRRLSNPVFYSRY